MGEPAVSQDRRATDIQRYVECGFLLKDNGLAILLYVVYIWVFNMVVYIRVVKRRIILFAHLFPGVLLLFLVGNYGRLPAESAPRAEAKCCEDEGEEAAGDDGRRICLSSQWGYEV